LATRNPELAAQLIHPAEAQTVTEYSHKKLFWFCENEHPRWEWEATVANRSASKGCGVCAGREVLVGCNDLGTRSPDLAAQLVNPAEAQTVTEYSNRKLRWFCETEHPRWEWEANVASRSTGNGCSVCSGKYVLAGWNDLGSRSPDLAAQLVNPTESKTVTEYSNRKLRWFCENEHPRWEWEATVGGRSSGLGCSVCSSNTVLTGWNDLGTRRPEIAARLVNPDDAQTVTEYSTKKLLWFCENEHPRREWKNSVGNMSSQTTQGCLVCSEYEVLVGWNDLGTRRPDLAAQLVNPDEALVVTDRSTKKLLWFCENEHPRWEWHAMVCSRARGNGCSVCAGQFVLVGWNDLATRRPDLAEQLLNPAAAKTVTTGSQKKLLWFCENEHPRREWWASVKTRSNGGGCSVCASSGFDVSKSGICYMISGVVCGRPSIKFGISNTDNLKDRLAKHRRTGLSNVHALADFEAGQDCKDFETCLKHLMRDLGIPSCDSRGYEFDGKTESFLMEDSTPAFFAQLCAKFTALGARPVWATPQAQAA
jgi:hypothetical protein